MEKIELKVSNKTEVRALAGAIANSLKDKKIVIIKVIGAGALNQAIKAIAIARGFIVVQGIDINCIPSFYTANIDNEDMSAIMLTIERK